MASTIIQPLTTTQTGGAQQINLVGVANTTEVQVLVATLVNESQTVNLQRI